MTKPPRNIEPRWPAILALFAVGGLQLALPESLSVGPPWLLIAIVSVLAVPTIWTRRRGIHELEQDTWIRAHFGGHCRDGVVPVSRGGRTAFPQRSSHRAAAVRGRSLDCQHPGLRFVVLAARCRRPACPRIARRAYRWRIPLPADDPLARGAARHGRSRTGARVSSTTSSSPSTPARHFRRPIARCCPAGPRC